MFYAKRTPTEQQQRLPQQYQDYYIRTQLDRIEIDGHVLQGYFEYSYMNEKSYVEQPERASDGSIEEIDNYTTIITPRLVINYSMMDVEDYRTLMKLLLSKNSFTVVCYDIVEDKRVVHDMYFAPPQMPVIYQQYLKTLGIQKTTIELIGTNRPPKQPIPIISVTDDGFEIFDSSESAYSFTIAIEETSGQGGVIGVDSSGKITIVKHQLSVGDQYQVKAIGKYGDSKYTEWAVVE